MTSLSTMRCVIAAAILTVALSSSSANAISYRLPEEVKPLHYDITLRPDFHNNIFTGDVEIEVQALKNTSTITIHQLLLTIPPKDAIQVIELSSLNVISVAHLRPGELEEQEFFQITLFSPLTAGNRYLIKIPNFGGIFDESHRYGFYYAKYTDDHGNLKTFATTQFEPTYARKAFPCFDEPALKATFRLTIVRPSTNYISASNTPRDEGLSSELKDVFKKTKLMSTYLVAFIVSEMEFSSTVDRNRILAPSDVLKQNKHLYALNVSSKILREMEFYTGIPYSFEKLDHASIPYQYYAAGAMENWGLITYMNIFLLVEPNAGADKKQPVATTIAHEIGHQWFGNLVSPTWWEYIWLNEGFANYFEHYLSHTVEPHMDIWKSFVLVSGRFAMNYDGISHFTRPMNQQAETPSEVSRLFDAIAYGKSGAVIRMLEHIVSTTVFKQGLTYYLNDRQYKAATPLDLYKNIQRALNESSQNKLPQLKTVKDLMTTWDSVAGFPLVTVKRNYNNLTSKILLKQRAFSNDNNQGVPGKWMVPINYATNKNPSFDNTSPLEWLVNSCQTITVPNLDSDDWIIVNVQQTGYYRVNYDERNWNLISNLLLTNHSKIHVFNRGKLLDDCHLLKTSGDISYDVCDRLEEYVVYEEDPYVLSVLTDNFADTDNRLYYTKHRNPFKDRVIYLLQGAYDRLSFDEQLADTFSDHESRANIIFWLCKVGHLHCRSKTYAEYNAWKNNRTEIPASLQTPILCGAMRANFDEDFNYLFKILIETKDYNFKTRIAAGMTCTENVRFLKRLLHYCLIKKLPTLLEHVINQMQASSKNGLETVLNFVIDNIDELQAMFGNKVKVMIEKLASQTYSTIHIKNRVNLQLKTGSTNLFTRALAKIRSNAEWLKKNEYKIINSFRKFVK